jgi:arylsulfatase A-like enzyme
MHPSSSLAVLLAASTPFASVLAEPSARPNILVILADDVGPGDAGAYGATKIRTPHIDRLAAEGRRFDNGYASAAVCTPTRYSLLTGQYAWRQKADGVRKGVGNGLSPLLIPAEMTTVQRVLQQGGYHTAVIGKWHLGFGRDKPDYNADLRPGPLETGFDEFFGIPATNDRIPTVFVRNHRVVGLDPADPITVSYDKAEAEARGLSSWAAGRNRIGWGQGGKAAWWKDEDIAEAHTGEAVRFLERNADRPFFLFFAPHDVHAPKVPQKRFAGASGISERADMLLGLDDAIGQVLRTLDRLGLTKNTLIIYSSDNGAYVNEEGGHRPTGLLRGIKSTSWEGGTRVPFVVTWPGHIRPGVSRDLVSTIDIPATVCAAAGIAVPAGALPDSVNLLPALLDAPNAPQRDSLILQNGSGDLAVRSGPWKFIPDLDLADGWKSKKKDRTAAPRPGLFNLAEDPGEERNVIAQHPDEAKRLADLLATIQSSSTPQPK